MPSRGQIVALAGSWAARPRRMRGRHPHKFARAGGRAVADALRKQAAAKTQRVVCAWCDKVMQPGVSPASHGICPKCAAREFPDDAPPRKNPAPGAAPRQIMVRKFRSARGHLVSGDVDAVSYVHIGSRSLQPYRHSFRGTDTELWALADGSLLIRNPSSRLWEDFTVEDAE